MLSEVTGAQLWEYEGHWKLRGTVAQGLTYLCGSNGLVIPFRNT